MRIPRTTTLRGLAVLALWAGLGLAGPVQAAEAVRQLEWDDLMPKDWDPLVQLEALRDRSGGTLEDGSPEANALFEKFVAAGRSAPVVPELDGQRVKIPGFVVPLDFIGKNVTEFLLVPYFGACIHVPPPPANQIVYVQSAAGHDIGGLFEPVWVTGTLTTRAFHNDVGDAGYTLQASKVEPYEEP